ncbi:hypothetical protein ACP70R_032747 [Stipagrostis hirtigluma subsp. patula]
MVSSSVTPRPPPPAAASGWAGLPRDVLWSVFVRVGQRDVLRGAGLVCAAWWRFARDEAALWRRVDLTEPDGDDDDDDAAEDGEGDLSDSDVSFGYLFDDPPIYEDTPGCKATAPAAVDRGAAQCETIEDREDTPAGWKATAPAAVDRGAGQCEIIEGRDDTPGWKAMALAAVGRSAGQCEAFWSRADEEVLLYLADRAPSLKSLRVTPHNDVSSEAFIEIIKKFPLLEELQLVLKSDVYNHATKHKERSTYSWAELLQSACASCSHLQHFTVRHVGREWHAAGYYQWKSSPKPFSIPTMHSLHSLKLYGGSFTKDVVINIVEHCPSLKSLDISDVPCLDPRDDDLRNKCSRIKDLSFPSEVYDSDSDRSYDSDSDEGECCCGGWL